MSASTSSSSSSSYLASTVASRPTIPFVCDEEIVKLFPLKSISDVVQLFKVHLETAKEPDLTLLSIVTGIIENTLTGKCNSSLAAVTESTSVNNNNIAEPINNNGCVDNGSGGGGSTVTDTTKVNKVEESNHSIDNNISTASNCTNFPVVTFETVKQLYEKFMKIISLIGPCKRIGVKEVKKSSRSTSAAAAAATATAATAAPAYATREIIKQVSDVIWNSLIRSTYKDRAHLQSLYSYLADNKLDCFGVAFAVIAGLQQLGYSDAHLAVSEDHAWVVFGKTGEETIEVTWHGKGAEDKRGQSVTIGYESHSWLYLSGNAVICDRYIEVGAIVSSINPSLSSTSACLEVADLQQQLLWLLYDMDHLKRYPMAIGCLGELEEVAPTKGRPACLDLYQAAVVSAKNHYKNHHVYPYTYQGGYHYRQKQYKDAFSAWANASDVIRLFIYSARDDEEIYKEFLDIANELIPHIMKMESSGHSAKSILRDPHCFANLLRFYDGLSLWEQGSLTPILHIGWVKPLVTTISRFDFEIRSQVIIHCAKDEYDVNEANTSIRSENNNNNNDVSIAPAQEAVDKKPKNSDDSSDKSNCETVRTTLVEALTAACGEKILNPDFLLQGGGRPFADQQAKSKRCDESEKQLVLLAQTSPRHEATVEITEKHEIKTETKAIESLDIKSTIPSSGPVFKETSDEDIIIPKRPEITLYSQKMKGLKELLLAEKVNTHAISLQLTAQSQVQVAGRKSRSIGVINYSTSTKRSRRE